MCQESPSRREPVGLIGSDPESALAVLPVIEQTATAALAEMRSLVAVLRDDERAERAPVQGLADLRGLADAQVDGPRVTVDVSGDVDDLGSSVDAAVFRTAQESVTNARWHANEATRIDVRVRGDAATVRIEVEVEDDGRSGRGTTSSHGRGRGSGFVIPGMRERVELLGGRLEAGSGAGGGWSVAATIPRRGPSR